MQTATTSTFKCSTAFMLLHQHTTYQHARSKKCHSTAKPKSDNLRKKHSANNLRTLAWRDSDSIACTADTAAIATD